MAHTARDIKNPTAHPSLTRRSLVRAGALATGVLALAVCSWTPRNAQ